MVFDQLLFQIYFDLILDLNCFHNIVMSSFAHRFFPPISKNCLTSLFNVSSLLNNFVALKNIFFKEKSFIASSLERNLILSLLSFIFFFHLRYAFINTFVYVIFKISIWHRNLALFSLVISACWAWYVGQSLIDLLHFGQYILAFWLSCQ